MEPTLPKTSLKSLSARLQVGDVVFIHIPIPPFGKIAHDTGSWVNHVGIVVDISGEEPLIAESKVPLSTTRPLSRFIRFSRHGRIAMARLPEPLTFTQQEAIRKAAGKRMGIWYDGGFDLYSRRQFCSRFVREVIAEALGIDVGTIESLQALFAANPQADLLFWRLWYLGTIPWQRQTVTPASLLNDPRLQNIFDGYAAP